MTKAQYAKLLLRPEWKARRWEVLRRDKYSCRDCNKTIITGRGLHVHHLYYIGNNNPWDYPEDALVTLCAKCHEKIHNKIAKRKPDSDSQIKLALELSTKTSKLLNLNALDLKLYLVLADMSPVKLPNPVRDLISRRIGMSLPKIQTSLSKLKTKGLIRYNKTVWVVV